MADISTYATMGGYVFMTPHSLLLGKPVRRTMATLTSSGEQPPPMHGTSDSPQEKTQFQSSYHGHLIRCRGSVGRELAKIVQ